MPLTIPDEWLRDAGITPDDARLEFACRLYDGGRLSFGQAIRWSGLTRTDFEAAMLARGLPLYRPTVEDLQHDLDEARRVSRQASTRSILQRLER
jgi:predicted HTH domain antitoxin